VKKGVASESKSNEMEAALVRVHVGKLVDAGVRAEDIAVITPYNAQVCISPSGAVKDVVLVLQNSFNHKCSLTHNGASAPKCYVLAIAV
jgi:hypothetical protein